MALPVSREQTAAPGSQVHSAMINQCQDAIIAEHARLGGGAGYGPIVLADAPTAPDYHLSAPRFRHFSPMGGKPQTVGTWDSVIAGTVQETATAPGRYTVGLFVDEGDIITVTVSLSQSVAIAGGGVSVDRLGPAVGYNNVASQPIATATGDQLITIVSGHNVVAGCCYEVSFLFGSGASNTKAIGDILVAYTR